MIDIQMHTQPDDETCGATCLQSIYNYYGFNISLEQVVGEVERSISGGTLAPLLAKHALQNNFNTTIYVNDLNVFDPTWFANGAVSTEKLHAKLEKQMKHKTNPGIEHTSLAYQQYIRSGGVVRFHSLNVQLLKKYFEKKTPILTGLSATYLYSCARELYTPEGISTYDDIRGTPCGHFVVLCGYDEKKKRVVVADPHRENPLSHNNYYTVNSHHLINAIMLGVFTYDANLLIIEPKGI